MSKLDPASDAYQDLIVLEALKLVEASLGGEQAADAGYRALDAATRQHRGPGLDPLHVAQWLALQLGEVWAHDPDGRAILRRNIDEISLIVAAEIPDTSDLES